jgi:hypothetical protein
MDSARACDLLRILIKDLEQVPASIDEPSFVDWKQRAGLALRRILQDDHKLVADFDRVGWAWIYDSTPQQSVRSFEGGRTAAAAILKGAIFELEELAEPADFAGSAAIDPELWEHVRQDVETERWGQVASQAAIFVESKVREWAGRPSTEVSTNLMTAVLRPNGGEFPLGRNDSEKEGWLALGRGFMLALRNVDTHRIQERSDDKRYAMGVLGTASLLVTQLCYEHGNRFRT